jgi:hypothetical protein
MEDQLKHAFEGIKELKRDTSTRMNYGPVLKKDDPLIASVEEKDESAEPKADDLLDILLGLVQQLCQYMKKRR